jgi:hypothetical protein
VLRPGRRSAVVVLLALCALPAGLSAPPAVAAPPPAPVATALFAAAAATSADLAGGIADLPPRGRLALRRAGAAALASLLPVESRARLDTWRERALAVSHAATTLRVVRDAASGSVDRALNAAALVAVAAFALRLALRSRVR